MSELKEGDKVIFAGKTGTITEVTEGARYPYRVVLDSGGQGLYTASELKEAGATETKEEREKRLLSVIFSPEQAKKLLANWIDPSVIADALVDAMSEVYKPEEMTFENAKLIYYNFLETELTDALRRSRRFML